MQTVTEYFDKLLKAPENKLCRNNTKEDVNNLLQMPVKDILFHYLGPNLLNGICALRKTTNINQILFRLLLEGIAPNNIPFYIKDLSLEEQNQFPDKYGVKLVGENPKAPPIYLFTKIKEDPQIQDDYIYKAAYSFEDMELVGGEEPLNYYCDTYKFLYSAIQQKMLTKEVQLPTILPKDSVEEIAKKIGARKQWIADYESDITYLSRYSDVPAIFVGDEIEVYLHGSDHPPTKTIVEKIMIEQEGIFLYHKDELNKMCSTHLKTYGYHWNKVDVLQEESLNISPIAR